MSFKVEMLLGMVLVLCLAWSPINGFPQKAEAAVSFDWLLDSESWTSKDPVSIVPQETFTECGGVVPVTDTLNIIEYMPTGGIPGHLRCVWILHANLSSIGVYFDTFRLPADSGLSIFYVRNSSTTAMDIFRVPPIDQSEHVVLPYGQVYLVLSSNAIGGGAGFRAGVRVSGNPSTSRGFSAHHSSASGGMRSHNGQYENNEYSAVVVQPPYPSNETWCTSVVGVSTLDSEDRVDVLDIYTLAPYHSQETSVERHGRFSGYHPFGPVNSTTTSTEPRVFTFITDGSVTGTGFNLAWRCE